MKNQFREVDLDIQNAKMKLNEMKDTEQVLEEIDDPERQKKYLRQENIILREQLKKMSINVNKVIEFINKEALRKQKNKSPAAVSKKAIRNEQADEDSRIRAAEQEIKNTEK